MVPRVTGIHLAHSNDGGATIATRTLVSDAAVGPYYLLPRIAREDSGALDITTLLALGGVLLASRGLRRRTAT